MTRDLVLGETSPRGWRGVPGGRIIMYVGGGDASERDYLSESRRLVSTHCR